MSCGLLGGLLLGLWPAAVRAGEEAQLEASILRVKPAVVLISSEVGAEVSVNCGAGPVHQVTPDPIYETGSGFILHPDGFIATNGHVVERFFEMNEQRLAKEFMAAAVAALASADAVEIEEPDVAGVSFPAFFETLEGVMG